MPEIRTRVLDAPDACHSSAFLWALGFQVPSPTPPQKEQVVIGNADHLEVAQLSKRLNHNGGLRPARHEWLSSPVLKCGNGVHLTSLRPSVSWTIKSARPPAPQSMGL